MKKSTGKVCNVLQVSIAPESETVERTETWSAGIAQVYGINATIGQQESIPDAFACGGTKMMGLTIVLRD